MRVLVYARSRVDAVIEEISRLKEVEFPYSDSSDALAYLQGYFQDILNRLNLLSAESNPEVAKRECSESLYAIFLHHPLLGFILRSTNVRNAFEVFRPLRRLASDLLEPDVAKEARKTRLVLSSEWDYSPITYHNIPQLPNFVMTGLPAAESSNPLLVPLAGHEFGHPLSLRLGLHDALRPTVKRDVVAALTARWDEYTNHFPMIEKPEALTTSLLALPTWEPIVPIALKQAEEAFCDFVGVRVFAESYLSAFAYLLAPGCGKRSMYYPSTTDRVGFLLQAAAKFAVAVPSGYGDMFEEQDTQRLTPADLFRLSIADQVVSGLIDSIIDRVYRATEVARLPMRAEDEVARIYRRLQHVVPAEGCKTLADVLNAGWRAHQDPALWASIPQLVDRRALVLRELLLKNIELFEIETIVGGR